MISTISVHVLEYYVAKGGSEPSQSHRIICSIYDTVIASGTTAA